MQFDYSIVKSNFKEMYSVYEKNRIVFSLIRIVLNYERGNNVTE